MQMFMDEKKLREFMNSPGMIDLIKRLEKRLEAERRVKEQGGNKYKQLEARLFDTEKNKFVEDPVIYAIRTIKSREDVIDFYKGYYNHIKDNMGKYKLNSKNDAKNYAIYDVQTALNLHFCNPKTHKLWNPISKKQLK
jgi:hypothetical protein